MVWCALRRESSSKNRHQRPFESSDTSLSFDDGVVGWLGFVGRLGLFVAISVAAVLFAPGVALGQSGVLIPSSTERPDPAVLSLDEMSVNVLIDNQYARVRV